MSSPRIGNNRSSENARQNPNYTYKPKVKTFNLSKGAISCKKGSVCNVAMSNYYVRNECADWFDYPKQKSKDRMPDWKLFVLGAVLALALFLVYQAVKSIYEWMSEPDEIRQDVNFSRPSSPQNSELSDSIYFGQNEDDQKQTENRRYDEARQKARTAMGQLEIKNQIQTIQGLIDNGLQMNQNDLKYLDFLKSLVGGIFSVRDPNVENFRTRVSEVIDNPNFISNIQDFIQRNHDIIPDMYFDFLESFLQQFYNIVNKDEFTSDELSEFLETSLSQQVGQLSQTGVYNIVTSILGVLFDAIGQEQGDPVTNFIQTFLQTRLTPERSPMPSLLSSRQEVQQLNL